MQRILVHERTRDSKTKYTITTNARCVVVAPLFICNIQVTAIFFLKLILVDIEKYTSAQLVLSDNEIKPKSIDKARPRQGQGPRPTNGKGNPIINILIGVRCVILNRMCKGDRYSKPLTVISSIECKQMVRKIVLCEILTISTAT